MCSSPPHAHLGFAFPSFSYPLSAAVQKYYMEKFRNKQFISITLHAITSNMVKFLVSLALPDPGTNHPFIQRVHAAYAC